MLNRDHTAAVERLAVSGALVMRDAVPIIHHGAVPGPGALIIFDDLDDASGSSRFGALALDLLGTAFGVFILDRAAWEYGGDAVIEAARGAFVAVVVTDAAQAGAWRDIVGRLAPAAITTVAVGVPVTATTTRGWIGVNGTGEVTPRFIRWYSQDDLAPLRRGFSYIQFKQRWGIPHML